VTSSKGLTTRNYAEANALNAIVHVVAVYDNYYPNLFKKIVAVNSNADFVALFNVLVPSFEQTSKQFTVFTEEEIKQTKEFISQFVDPESLNIF
jgi:hypothetical protein